MTIKRVMGFVATFGGWLLLVLAAVEIGLVFYYRPTLEYAYVGGRQVNPVLAHRRISRVRLRSILDTYRQLVVVGWEPVAPTVNRGRMGKGASRALDPTMQLTIRFDGIGPWATGFRSLHSVRNGAREFSSRRDAADSTATKPPNSVCSRRRP